MDSSQPYPPSVEDLLRSGKPFVPFPEFSVHDICDLSHEEAIDWLECKLQEEKPFIIHGFDKLDKWDKRILSSKSLVDLSSSGSIPVRNCQTGRDVRMKLADLFQFQTDHTQSNNIREFLYAKDLQCPGEWVKALKAILPSSLQHLGSLDLFRVLPREIAPEVLMAYAGTQGSLCFSGSVALNLMIESKDRRSGSICFGTDRQSQTEYDVYMEELGKSPHTDWTNVSIAQLRSANFPIYVTFQEPGDLIVYPSATSHQVWNIGPMVTRVVWNVMHTSSMASFFDYIQPAYQRQCHTDTGRVPLIPLHALRDPAGLSAKELKLLLEIFERLVDDDDAGPNVPVKLVDTQGAVVECRNHWVFWLELRQMLDDSLWNGFAICAETTMQCGKASHAPSALRSSASVAYTDILILISFLCSEERVHGARIKPADPRGRIMGFVDNVFDQKRGKRASAGAQVTPSQMTSPQARKGPRSNSSEGFEQGALARSRISRTGDTEPLGIVRSEPNELRSRGTAQPNIHLAKVHSYGNSWPKGQLRICDLVESRVESAAAEGNSRNHTTQYQPAAHPEIPNRRDQSPREENCSPSSTFTSTSEESIPVLEKRLEALRRYAGDLLELSLVESHAKLLEKISAYEIQIEQIRRRKAERLFSNLNRDFPDLANVAMEEARRRGL
ncbi:hypothetical protein KXV68_002989 [Aspergillus fumigatus]|nr:hypothetical protein KXV68_002989 [Aspergillus fumigatus]KAH2349076.1 hypothetical protein KXW91_003673 [Aspergillus fumigatus]KAH2824649.1 hypothetical protein KXW76_004227 [Aspergillus fumigatus]KAH3291112.1 hypothetical protein KXW74_003848 [Aspergillus fumigatus]